MDLEIKKDITSNWFKMLQEAIWHTITNLERKDADIKTTVWNRSKKRDEGGGEFRILKNVADQIPSRLLRKKSFKNIFRTASGEALPLETTVGQPLSNMVSKVNDLHFGLVLVK